MSCVGLEAITLLSREFGCSDFVKGGGGNTSFKTDDTLWIKPSGTALADMEPSSFIALDRRRLARLYEYSPASDVTTRERDVQELMAAARAEGHAGRPSVETPLHDLLRARFIVHTHPMLVNGLTCGRQGREGASRLFPDALWVPYIDPGYTLSMEVRKRVADFETVHGQQPHILLLENHGIFVCGESPGEVRDAYHHVVDTLVAEYDQRNIPRALTYGAPAPSEDMRVVADRIHQVLGDDGAFAQPSAPFAVVEGPLTPDHMVYAKAHPFIKDLNHGNIAEFRTRWGYPPRVISASVGVFGVGRTAKSAALALDLARDGALVRQLAAAFGGVRYMSEPARRFIESWEVESYREQQSLRKTLT